ncbi:cysteine--tRNA ligase [Candidatus Riflebacteria bacterium]
MTLKIYNSLSRKKEEFKSLLPNEVNIYICGVTVYDDAHIGHLRPAVVFDAFNNFFHRLGFAVRMVVNFTDIDDKIIARSMKEGRPWYEISEEYIGKYLKDLANFDLKDVFARPKASEHIEDMHNLISVLIDNNNAYQDKTGNVWFDVHSFREYGKLSNRTLEKLKDAEPTDCAEGEKKNPHDFCLWKAAKPDEPSFDSPYGKGRPGWHLECSAMIHTLLGKTIDIHAGGLDLIFPHHENEIAQSEAANDQPLANYWMHCGLVTMAGEKMAKSLGNIVTIQELLKKYSKNSLVHFFHSTHYRSPLEFSHKKMLASQKASKRMLALLANLEEYTGGIIPIDERKKDTLFKAARLEKIKQDLRECIFDDFNFPKLLGLISRNLKSVYTKLSNERRLSLPDHQFVTELVSVCKLYLKTLGFKLEQAESAVTEDSSSLLDLLIKIRNLSRQEKQFHISDKIRAGLKELGYSLEDTPVGTRWRKDDG